jgi:DnaJ-class molecular chaperone
LAASLAAPVFNSVPRSQIQYSIEPLDSFHKYVYDSVIEGKGNKSGSGSDSAVMTKADARLVLGLEEGCNDLSLIKKAYRNKSFALHPDRFVGVERSDGEIKSASDNFAEVRCAYDTLSSGIRNSDNAANTVENGMTGETSKGSSSNSRSWYESLGGKARNGFFGPVELISVEKAKEQMTTKAYKSAVAGLNHDTVMSFVARNQAAATSR